MSGQTLEFTRADLAACAKAYDPAIHEAPIVIGHPETDAPAYGWISRLSVSDQGLEGVASQVDPAFADMVNAGRFKKKSASFYIPDSPNNPVPGVYYLRHVGFLGAQPPAVKGLRDVRFGEDTSGIVTFSEENDESKPELVRQFFDWFKNAIHPDAAFPVKPPETEPLPDDSGQQPTHKEKNVDQDNPITPPPEEQLAGLSEENQQLKETVEQLRQQLQALQDSLAEKQKERIEEEAESFAEGLVREARLLPKDKATVTAVLKTLASDRKLEFSENGESVSLYKAFTGFLKSLPAAVSFGELAVKPKNGMAHPPVDTADFSEKTTDPDRLNLHVRASSLAAEKGISYEQAARLLCNR